MDMARNRGVAKASRALLFPACGPRKRQGGFVNRNYGISYAGQRLVAITYAEPGAQGRFEQFIVMPRD